MAKRQELYMGTTEITPERSAGEITSLLVRVGAKQIATDYKEGKISGLRFVLTVSGLDFTFELPARTGPVYNYLKKRRPYNSSHHRVSSDEYERKQRDDAERIGWRQLFRWIEAQIALMDLGMVSAHEVFYPYLLGAQGRTVLREFEEVILPKMLTAGGTQ